ncbi:MAG TPA: hypothetical protein PLS12_05770 [Bacteroidales bacterium]|nr:hypothetical protein [Bacteroidales bacterium]
MNSEHLFLFEKIRSSKEIFQDAYTFIQQYAREYFVIVLLYAGPLFVVSSYFASQGAVEIAQTGNFFINHNVWYSLIADFFADVVLNGITFGSIILYCKTGDIKRDEVITFFNQNFWRILGITIISNIIISIGFMLLIIPGIVSLVPLTLFVYDKIYYNESFEVSFIRSFELVKKNIKLSFGVVFIMYIVIFGLKLLIESFLSVDMQNYILINTMLQTLMQILFSVSSIIIVLLYNSLRIQFNSHI